MLTSILYMISWIIVIGVASLVLFAVYVVQFLLRLQLFILSWRSLADCIKSGYSDYMCRTVLHALYRKNLLEVRLGEHVKSCENCQMEAIALVLLSDVAAELIIELPLNQLGTEKLLDLFERHMFGEDTIPFFEFRFTKRPHRRRFPKLPSLRIAVPQYGY